jgi:ABC-type transporter MlaC component
MKKIPVTILFGMILLFAGFNSAFAQQTKANDMFKNYINRVVQRVKKAKTPQKKRELMNHSFNRMLKAFDRVTHIKQLSEADQAGLKKLSNNIKQKKYELNGTHGYERVADSQLGHFANYFQQDLEQANTVTISITVLLLIIILVVLLIAL